MIIERVRNHDDIAKSFGSDLLALSESDSGIDYHRMTFLAEQLKLLNLDPRGNRYGQLPVTFRTAISLYLRGRNSYKELR